MINRIQSIYATGGITVNQTTTSLSGMPSTVAVGDCDLDNPQLTNAQRLLFNSFSDDPNGDVMIFFVERVTATGFGTFGCSVHPVQPLRLRSIISENAPDITLAHEVGHNLGLRHSSDDHNLMFSHPEGIIGAGELTSGQFDTMIHILEGVQDGFSPNAFFFAEPEIRALQRRDSLPAKTPPTRLRERTLRSEDYNVLTLLRRLEEQARVGEATEARRAIYKATEIASVARGDHRRMAAAALRVLSGGGDSSRPVAVRMAAAEASWKLGRLARDEASWRLAALVAELRQDDSERVRRAAARSERTLSLGYAAMSAEHCGCRCGECGAGESESAPDKPLASARAKRGAASKTGDVSDKEKNNGNQK